jgi:hypothetical protein
MKILQDPKKRGLVAVSVLGILVLATLTPFILFRDARHLSAYANGAEDSSHVRDELALTGASISDIVSTPHLLADVKDPAHTLLVVMGVERRFDAGESDAVIAFLRAGGNVLLADEGGFGTAIARDAGFAFDSSRVLDSHNHRGDPKLVVVNSTLDGRTYRLLLNSPANLVPLPDRTGAPVVLASSSPADVYPDGSYRDVNANGEIDKGDPSGPFPLIVSTAVGAGRLILVADTGLFMNQQVDLAEFENGAYVRALAATVVGRDGTILVDESRHAPGPGLAPLDDAARALGRATAGTLVTYALLVLLVGGTALAVRLTRTTEDWSHHRHDVSQLLPAPEGLAPDLDRAQRFARRRISEKHNIPIEQVAAMSAEQILGVCGDKLLADAAAGTLRSDPSPIFVSYLPSTEAVP